MLKFKLSEIIFVIHSYSFLAKVDGMTDGTRPDSKIDVCSYKNKCLSNDFTKKIFVIVNVFNFHKSISTKKTISS